MKTFLNGELVPRLITSFPLTRFYSRNCTKHKIRCPYNDVQVPDAERSTTPDKPDLMWTPQVEAAIAEWQRTGIFPLPSLGLYPAPMPHLYPLEDLRLIYHVATLYCQLASIDANNFTLWTRHIPTLVQHCPIWCPWYTADIGPTVFSGSEPQRPTSCTLCSLSRLCTLLSSLTAPWSVAWPTSTVVLLSTACRRRLAPFLERPPMPSLRHPLSSPGKPLTGKPVQR